MGLSINLQKVKIEKNEISGCASETTEILNRLFSGREDMTGWVKLPIEIGDGQIQAIIDTVEIIKKTAELLIVIGVGGSYLGAKAAIDALPKTRDGIRVEFFGNDFCTDHYIEVLDLIQEKETAVCVISKSGNTAEVSAAFETVKSALKEKYGDERKVAERIIAITDEKKGGLRKETEANGYTAFAIPEDVGGRYSVFTAAGLFPMAASGIDIRSFISGAAEVAKSTASLAKARDYAASRHILQKQGYEVEFLSFCNSKLRFTGEWLKQLYAESEGKNGSGLLPASLMYSTDLHSMGQYLQQGRQNFFETFFYVDVPEREINVPAGTMAGLKVSEINRCMLEGVREAHHKVGIPILEIHIDALTPQDYGRLLYFLEITCAVTAMLDGVNPFDQPGVEVYKEEMRKSLALRREEKQGSTV